MPEFSSHLGNVTRSLPRHNPTVPVPGPVTIVFDVFSAYGVAWYPVIERFAANVTYGTTTSTELVVAQRA